MKNGKIGSFSRNDEHASDPGHGPVIVGGLFAASLGSLLVGLILSKNSAGALIPYAETADENIGTGATTTLTYADTLSNVPIEPGSVVVTDGVETFTDDGLGHLTGSAGGSGTVNYKTGSISVTFHTNPTTGAAITADYVSAIAGVLDENYDGDNESSGLYIIHGTCRQDVLKVGTETPAAPSATLLARLQAHGIYAR